MRYGVPQPPQSFFELLQISERLLLGSFFWERFRAKTAQGQFHLYNIFPSQGFSDCFYAHGFFLRYINTYILAYILDNNLTH